MPKQVQAGSRDTYLTTEPRESRAWPGRVTRKINPVTFLLCVPGADTPVCKALIDQMKPYPPSELEFANRLQRDPLPDDPGDAAAITLGAVLPHEP